MPSDRRRSSSTRSSSGSRRSLGTSGRARASARAGGGRAPRSGGPTAPGSMTESSTRSWWLDGQAAERTSVALGQATVDDRGLDRWREVEQPERVRDGRSGPTDALGDVVLGEPELVDELAVREGRLDRVEVLALQVLDEGELELLAVRELADDGGDPLEAGGDGGSKPSLAGDELVAVEDLGHEDRLDDPVLGDARRERGELVRHRTCAGLVRVRADPRRSGSRGRPTAPACRCGMSEARPRPRPVVRSGRIVMRRSRLRSARRPRTRSRCVSGSPAGSIRRRGGGGRRRGPGVRPPAWRYATAPTESGL